MTDERRVAAVHEAGHCVAARLLHVRLSRVVVDAYGAGATDLRDLEAPRHDRVLVALAGSIAEQVAGYPYEPADHDEQVVAGLRTPGLVRSVAEVRTRALLAGSLPVLLRLASTLEERGELAGIDLEAAISAAMQGDRYR